MNADPSNHRPAERARPFRRSLLASLFVLVVLLGTSLFAVSQLTLDRVLEKTSSSLAGQIVGRIEDKLHELFTPVGATLKLTLAAARAQVLGEPTLEQVESFLEELMKTLPQISSAELARQNGDAFMLLREGDGSWLSRHMLPGIWGSDAAWRRRRSDGEVTEWRAPFDYDVTGRPWFVGALAQHRSRPDSEDTSVSWTEPYAFATTGEPGITASAAIEEVEGALLVISLDILLKDLSRFALDVTRSEPGLVFILDGPPGVEGSRLLGVPFEPEEDDPSSLPVLEPPAAAGGVIADFSAIARDGAFEALEPARFESGSQLWWGMVERADLDSEHDVWIAVLIPERELREGLPPVRLVTFVATLLMLTVGVILALRLARTYSEPVDSLVLRSQRMERLNFEPFAEPVRSGITELRQLAGTFESLRQALAGFTGQREDLRIARSLRSSLLPAESLEAPPLEAAGWSECSDEVGGSAFELRSLPGEAPGMAALLLELGGHGIETAAALVRLSSVFRAAVSTGAGIESVAGQLRAAASDLGRPGNFRFWLAFADSESSTVDVVARGICWLAVGGDTEAAWYGEIELGTVTDAPPRLQSVEIGPGGGVAAFSSGVMEAVDDRRRPWGRQGIEAVFAATSEPSAAHLRAALVDGLQAHDDGAPEDRALVVLSHHA